MISPICPLLVSASLMASLAAQTVVKKKTKAVTEISIVAIGAKPNPRFKKDDDTGDLIMLFALPGEVPPNRLYYKGKSSTDKKTEWKSYNISFNRASQMKPISPEKTFTLYLRKPDGKTYKKYLTIPAAAEGSRRIIFLTPSIRDPKPWDAPPLITSLLLNSKEFKGKQFILKNLSHVTVMHAFEETVVLVPPKKTITYSRKNVGILYRLAAQYDGGGTKKKIIYNTAVRLNGEGHIQLYALYDANPKTNSGRAVGVFRTIVPAPKLPDASSKP